MADVVITGNIVTTIGSGSSTPAISISSSITPGVTLQGELVAGAAGVDGIINSVNGISASSVTLDQDDVLDGTTNKQYSNTEKTKLAGIAGSATANSSDAILLARANHTGTQSADTLTDGTTNKAFLATERTKLSGIATGATANSSDATLLARANHTGTQLLATISDVTASVAEVNYSVGVTSAIQTQLNAKQALDSDLTTIAGLTATTDNFMVATSSAWASRTPTQARSQLGLGSLATQSGTFSGTSSGTNTGDQTISDATISTTDITTNNVTTAKHGFTPKAPNDAAKFLDGTGAWSTPAGAGDMVLNSIQTVTAAKTFNDAKLILAGVTSGTTVLKSGGTAGSSVITLPVATDTLVGKATTDVFTNKDLTSTTNTYPTGSLVQVVGTNFSAVATGTTTIPFDDTIPQITEGNEFMTQAITPKATTNILYIEAELFGSCSVGGSLMAALFQDSTANALALSSSYMLTATAPVSIKIIYRMVAGTTSSTTFRVRGGCDQAGTFTFNGTGAARKFGGITLSNVTIYEVKA